MSDLEGLTRGLINRGYSENEILKRLVQEYLDFKIIDETLAFKYAKAIFEECKSSDINSISSPFIKELLNVKRANVSVGKQGVGCRGAGDFFVHKLITELSETDYKAFLSPSSLDDAGAVLMSNIEGYQNTPFNLNNLIILSKMEGIHSRLSDFPFICGFHVNLDDN
ncbi:hypothetical protein LCGC14_2828670, partial [marine sediment metagenome]